MATHPAAARPPARLAVPENPVGLALILGIFDRCGNPGFASSATGSAKPESPLRGRQGHLIRHAADRYTPHATFPSRGRHLHSPKDNII